MTLHRMPRFGIYLIFVILLGLVIQLLLGIGFSVFQSNKPILNSINISVEKKSSMYHGELNFTEWWEANLNDVFYPTLYNITRDEFMRFPYRNGIHCKDAIFLQKAIFPLMFFRETIKRGDMVIYRDAENDLVAHRTLQLSSQSILVKGDITPATK